MVLGDVLDISVKGIELIKTHSGPSGPVKNASY